jgi:nitrate/TMAO reductase-like tetraheme cytochrome c subunit
VKFLRRWWAYPWLLRLLWLGIIALPLGVAAIFLGIEVSSQPDFCGSCHVMKPYYESWRTSKHNDVACVECHIPPGIGSELRKKYEALAMVASYFTGTYGTNPWAEVPDESCLRPGCHEQRLLIGRELFQGVLFDHRPHLAELRREKRLRCTSCHSQIVQGAHISVTESTCFLCHFKDVPLNQETARCTLCHEVPEKVITVGGLRFDHADVKRFGMECTLCHAGVVRGSGEVPRDRCLTCHNELERLGRYGETEFLHKTHVTDHKVECLSCHIEIQHRVPEQLEAITTSCKTCHVGEGHSPQRDLYVGIGGKGVEPLPSAMYLAGVRCEGCHLVTREGRRLASEVSCMACHGAQFYKVYQLWQETLNERLARVKAELQDVKGRLTTRLERLRAQLPTQAQQTQTGSVKLQAQQIEAQVQTLKAALELVRQAEENVTFVEQAHGVHNLQYTFEILWKAHEALQQALEETGIPQKLAPPWNRLPYRTRCVSCHFDFETFEQRYERWTFTHTRHAIEGGLRCSACHLDRGYRELKHGRVERSCEDCHPTRAQLARAEPEDCLRCHTAEIPWKSEKVRFSHSGHLEQGLDCALCHPGVTQLDHLEFLRTVGVPKASHELCGLCHREDVPPAGAGDIQRCLRCHTSF